MPQSDRITERAVWHQRTFGLSPDRALICARREFDLAEFWTPWELRDSAYCEDYLEWFIAATFTTVQ